MYRFLLLTFSFLSFTAVLKHCRALYLIVNTLLLSILSLTVNANQVTTTTAPASYNQCVACHGEKAQGIEQLKAPALAGQSASYLSRQLQNFTNGLRGVHPNDTYGMQMVAISKTLDYNKDVPDLTAYLSGLPPAKIVQTTTGNLKNGSRYYQARCGACHGGQAQGNPSMNAPMLSGQSIEYLQRQMLNFSTGVRGTHAEDKFGRQMAMMSKTSSGKELDDIFHYIAEQK